MFSLEHTDLIYKSWSTGRGKGGEGEACIENARGFIKNAGYSNSILDMLVICDREKLLRVTSLFVVIEMSLRGDC